MVESETFNTIFIQLYRAVDQVDSAFPLRSPAVALDWIDDVKLGFQLELETETFKVWSLFNLHQIDIR